MSWLLKLSNWLSGGALDRCQEQARLATARVKQTELQLESLQSQIRQTHKELTQAKAQLQISQGFPDRVRETQIQLKKIQDEYSICQEQLLEAHKHLDQSQTKLQKTTAELAKSQDWLEHINTPVKVLDVKKTLPKHEFNTLWGFGVSSPRPKTISTVGSIIVRGWVLGKRSGVELVKITYQDRTLLEVAANLPSLAIVQQYPDIPQAANSGFEFSLAVAGIPSPAELNLVAVLQDRSTIPLCALLLQ